MPSNPVYPNPPIAIVILEVRHPVAELSNPAMAFLKNALQEYTPIEQTDTGLEIDVQKGEQRPVSIRKLVSRDRHTVVTPRPDALVIETTDYRGWEWFVGVAEAALSARHEVAPVDGVERIGLRYIDEVRVPDDEPIDWSRWVIPSLLGPTRELTELHLVPTQQQNAVQYATSTTGQTLTLRYGVARGSVIQPNNVPRRPAEPTPGSPFFLIDTDGAWEDSGGMIPEFNVEEILRLCESLHAPSKEVFETLITEKLRTEVLNSAK
ncbi:TIGR04255 family protein [Williamsia sp. D3]|uniref:TIGR04255 family protein n=1 Tax=Williamsia sp. D3 TaxID=1313067 RepID=UPI0003D3861E|nr:TIGR04255 family protein [Williamsia sp. D3]ETD34419.1 membrane protein [Williamsia sp. D3]